MPSYYIIFYALGDILITLYEAFLSSVASNYSSCITVICIGAIGTTLHSCSAFSLAQYMYYKSTKQLIIKNSLVFFLIRLFISLISQIMYIYIYINIFI